jgi:hypothetical protein
MEALMPDLPIHATDAYGNYVCQKLLEVATEAQKDRLVAEITEGPTFKSVYANLHGSCVITALISSCSSSNQRILMAQAISSEMESIIIDPHGAIMLQQCVDTFEESQYSFIIDYVAKNFMSIATNRYGCCVVKKCIERVELAGSPLEPIVLENICQLSKDQYGNYVLQHCMELLEEESRVKYAHHVLEHTRALLFHKHGSNVIEKVVFLRN